MTFREKLKKEHLEYIRDRDSDEYIGGCRGCPYQYGYEDHTGCNGRVCAECWDREIPGTEEKPETNNIPVDMAALGTFIKEIAKDPNLYISIGIGKGMLNIGITHTSKED